MITRISKSPPAQAKCRWRQIFGAGGAIIQKKNKEKEKGKGKEERREKRKKETGEFNLEDPMFPIYFPFFLPKNYKIKILNSLKDWLERENGAGGTRWRPPSQSAFVHDGQISTAPHLIHYHS